MGTYPPNARSLPIRWLIFAFVLAALAAFISPRVLPTLPPQASAYLPLLKAGLEWTRILLAISAVVAVASGLILRWAASNGQPSGPSDPPAARFTATDGLTAAVLLLTSALVRIPNINRSLWWDELATVIRVVRRGLPVILAFNSDANNHTFNSLAMLFSSKIFGDAPWAYRLPGFLIGMLAPALVFLGLKQLVSYRLALVSGLLVAVQFRFVAYAAEARGYVGMIAFSMLAGVLFASLWRRFTPRLAAGYIVCCAAAAGFISTTLYLPAGHAVAALFVLGLLATRKQWADFHEKTRLLVTAIWAVLASIAVNILVLPQLVDYARHDGAWQHRSLDGELFAATMQFITGIEPDALVWLVVAACAGGWYCTWDRASTRALFAAVAFPSIFQLTSFALVRTPAAPRLFACIIFPLVIGLAYSLVALAEQKKLLTTVAAVALAAVIVGGMLPSFSNFYRLGTPDLRELSERLANQPVLLAGAQSDVNLYYFPTAQRVTYERTLESMATIPPEIRYIVVGDNCAGEVFGGFSQHGFQRMERLADYTEAEHWPLQRRPCMIVYERTAAALP